MTPTEPTKDPTQLIADLAREIVTLQHENIQLQIADLRKDINQNTTDIGPLKDVAVQFNLLIKLTLGGGALAVVNLVTLLYLLASNIKP